MAKKRITLEELAAQITKMDERMERGFAAVAEDVAVIREKMATSDQINSVSRIRRFVAATAVGSCSSCTSNIRES